MNLTAEEQELLESVERGDWRRIPDFEEEAERIQATAKATFRKDKRVNIRISERDLAKLQVKALEEGLPYQTFIASILHKFVTGRLVDIAASSIDAVWSPEFNRARVEAGLSNEALLTLVREQRASYRTNDNS
jgi:predicted DNA binding CopG/RHH family protein